ncbi:MAG: hypothetical protein A2Z86_07995 [Candidatus Glassbacteria bacterium GWA2_58_10]|uniref:DUF3857 domain-containing protein n=1 Tax=Candidatus Glassbacteria bacterium GWA2_58_10 TaxID=1817865 RepID=A0A1F5Y9M7_9BACT|nr:MAG: hypothetical protein A2Z86_07995 [Candidatus Glassbacteria bacterium GWA2_58_10]
MNTLKRLNRLLTAVLFFQLALIIPAPAGQAGRETLDRLAAAGGLDKYPDANALVVEDRREVTFQADGTFLDRRYELVKVLTETGKNSYGEAGFDYSRQYDAVRIEFARVIKPDGSAVEVPAEMIKDVTHPALAQMNIYDANVRIQMVTFQNLEVGDAIEYAVVDSCFLAPCEGEYDIIDLFQGSDPLLHKRLEINGPDSKPLHHLVKDGKVDFSTAKKNGRTSYVWETHDVPRIVAEPSMPSYLSFAPRLLASTWDSWNQMSKWWYDMTLQYRNQNDSLKAAVAGVTKGMTTDEEKIKAVYHFVAQKIRYMGLGTGKKAGFEPKPATETLSTRYGVCRDVAILMCSMLDDLGIKCYPVLTRATQLVDTEIPTIGFNHAIVALPDGKGGYRYSDPTVENFPELLFTGEGDASMLVCTPDGETIQTSAHSPAGDNMGTISATSRIDESGRLVSEATINTRGIYDVAFRSFVKRYPPQELNNIWQQVVTGVHPGARLLGFSTSDPEDLYTPFGLRFSYEVEDYAIQAGKYLLIKSPISTNSFELILQSFLSAAGLPERQYPLDLGVTLGSSQQENLVLPAGYKVKSLPETVDLESGGLSYKMEYGASAPTESKRGLDVRYEKKFLIDSKELDTQSYLELKKILRSSSRSGRGEIILQKDE